MTTLPLDTSVEAQYEDGFILSETELSDVSPYNPTHNVLRAIINGDPEQEHGKLVRFSCFYNNQRFDVDWSGLPDNARPIRFRDGFMTLDNAGNEESGWSGCRFGYQFTDEHGKNQQEVQEL
jgi:hypothetical protein